MIKAQNSYIFRGWLVSLVLLLAGCFNPLTDPHPLLLETEVNTGPPEYRQGYHDGCRSAMAAYGTSYMKTVYKINKQAQYATSRMYNQAWKDSWNYCYMSIFMIRQDDDSLL